MDNYEERMFRIKARSQQILASRKKMRRRIISVCIPVLVCGVAVVFMLPKDNGKTKGDGDSLHQKPQTSIQDVALYKSVLCFEGDRYNITITDQKTITAVKEMLTSYFVGDQLATSSPSVTTAEDDSENSEKRETLSIQFFDGDVVDMSYHLTGNELKCLQTGKTVRITEAQIDEIRRYIQ